MKKSKITPHLYIVVVVIEKREPQEKETSFTT